MNNNAAFSERICRSSRSPMVPIVAFHMIYIGCVISFGLPVVCGYAMGNRQSSKQFHFVLQVWVLIIYNNYLIYMYIASEHYSDIVQVSLLIFLV